MDGDSRFKVEPRLAALLSQEYSSSERALKELVDNAWDADATAVWIFLPEPMTQESLTVEDNGVGMTEQELIAHYFAIASDRRSKRGERTAGLKRLIKGRKGIGKFAGLMAASVMQLETSARGVRSSFRLALDELEKVQDIEHYDLGHQTQSCGSNEHGTKIVLSELHQHLAYPDPEKLRQVLLREYSRAEDFTIYVNNKALAIDDFKGAYREQSVTLPAVGKVDLRFAIIEAKRGIRDAGITIRVAGKAVGKPSFFGLDKLEDFPVRLLPKLYGELDADGLSPHVTAGWDSIIENSHMAKEVEAFVQEALKGTFKEHYAQEMQLANARLQKRVNERLARLPEHKRTFADRAIKRVLDRYYGEPESKVEPIVYVVLEALESSDYRMLVEHLADANKADIGALADALEEFGLADMAHLVQQADARSTFLDQLEALASRDETLESQMHRAIERNLWIFGPEYSLFSSNKTLRNQVVALLGREYSGPDASKRPDLLLNENLNGEYLLVEFKRPSHALTNADYQQLTTYRRRLVSSVGDRLIVPMLIGGRKGGDLPRPQEAEPGFKILLFNDVISSARRQLQWLLRTED